MLGNAESEESGAQRYLGRVASFRLRGKLVIVAPSPHGLETFCYDLVFG